jgi:hypothetical protein
MRLLAAVETVVRDVVCRGLPGVLGVADAEGQIRQT